MISNSQNTTSDTNPFYLKMNVRASISTGKSTVHIRNKSEDPKQFYDYYAGLWMGADNPHMDYQMLSAQPDGSGEATLNVPILRDDFDFLKIEIGRAHV